ncbi:MAG: hypothetical protein HQ557_03240 [Bacteroidetes bacterium]|nr:hypothetical protein [Bacteroidota bacterium]
MENEVKLGALQFKISFFRFFVLLILLFSPFTLFGIDSDVESAGDEASPEVQKYEQQNLPYRTEPWRVGVTKLLLHIENPESDDYLVLDYINSLLLEQLTLFNFHILSDAENKYFLQNSAAFEKESYDTELFSSVYNESLAFLRNQEAVKSSNNSISSNISEESIIQSGRIPVTIITRDNEQTLPFLSLNDKVLSLIISKNLNLDTIISSEIEKIGNVYIFRIFKFSLMTTDPVILLEYSFSKKNLYTISIKTLDAFSAGIGGFTRASLEIKTDIPDVQVHVDNNFYSITDLGLKILPPGEYEVTIYSEQNNFQDVINCKLEAGKITTIKPVIPVQEETLFSISIFPFNANVIDESQKKFKTPTEVHDIMGVQFAFFIEASGYLPQNLVIDNQLQNNILYSFHLRPDWMSLDSEISYGQLSFYKSFAATILSLPASVILYGLASEYDSPINETALGFSLAINFSLLLDTIISLVDYYNRTEVLL